MKFESQLRLLKPLLLHGTDRQDFAVSVTGCGLADSGAFSIGLEDLTDDGDSFSDVHSSQVSNLEVSGSSTTDFASLRTRSDLVRIAINDGRGALGKTVEQSGDGAAVNRAELVAVLSGKLDAEGSDARHTVRGGGSGDDLHRFVERSVEVIRRSQRKVGAAVGLKAGEERVAGATGSRLG